MGPDISANRFSPDMRFGAVNSKYIQNPREGSSRSRIFLFLLVIYVCGSLGCWFKGDLLAKRKTLQTANLIHTIPMTISKTVFCFFEKVTLKAASLKKLPCHGDFPHFSSIDLFYLYSTLCIFVTLTNTTKNVQIFPLGSRRLTANASHFPFSKLNFGIQKRVFCIF